MGRKSRLKRERRKQEELGIPPNLAKKFRDAQIHYNPPGEIMSDALVELIDPYMEDVETKDDLESLIGLAVFGWNLSVCEDLSLGEFGELLEEFDPSERDFIESFVNEIAIRKRLLFPENRRIIMGWETTVKPDGSFHLTVASNLNG